MLFRDLINPETGMVERIEQKRKEGKKTVWKRVKLWPIDAKEQLESGYCRIPNVATADIVIDEEKARQPEIKPEDYAKILGDMSRDELLNYAKAHGIKLDHSLDDHSIRAEIQQFLAAAVEKS